MINILAIGGISCPRIDLYVRFGVLSLAGLHAVAGVGFLYCIVNEPVELVFLISTLFYIAALAAGYLAYEQREQNGW